MNIFQKITVACLLVAAPFAFTQEHSTTYTDSSKAHPYFLKWATGDRSQSGDWESGSQLRTYADAHEGSYLVFADGGKLYRLDESPPLDAVEKVLAPMKDLSAQQKALAEKQKPLSQGQRELSRQMKAASGNPDEMRRLGDEMAKLGEQQGELGRQGGELGRQQGEIGKAFHERIESLIDDCLKSGSCHAVQS